MPSYNHEDREVERLRKENDRLLARLEIVTLRTINAGYRRQIAKAVAAGKIAHEEGDDEGPGRAAVQ
jgi:hypothetical protein